MTARNDSQRHMLTPVAVAACMLLASGVWAQTVPNAVNHSANQSLRDLRQLQHDVERTRADRQAQDLREKSLHLPQAPVAAQSQAPSGEMTFTVTQLTHTPSLVLSDQELADVFSEWEGRTIAVKDIAGILDAVNALYRQKGYLVCQAVVKPQRISQGRLEITLIEGVTDKVTVEELKSTNESYVRRAFNLPEGEVANYREMLEDLVRFNMTNDTALTVDISAGDAPNTSAYTIAASEPDRWGLSVFADTTGSESTGRPRAGASIVNRSLLGWRDSLTLLGVTSEGSKSAMAGYSIPLTSFGTRLSFTGSYGKVDIVDGPSADFDVSGESWLMSARLEHPFYVTQNQKWTVWGEAGRQKSTTDMFDVMRVADTTIETATAGVDGLVFGSRWLAIASVSVAHHEAEEATFGNTYRYQLAHVSGSARYTTVEGITISANVNSQIKLAGDELVTADHFYLGHTAGVRGYDNDVISAEEGATVSLEAAFPVAGPQSNVFVFADWGYLWGTTSYADDMLWSLGLGVQWPLFDGALLRTSAAFPMKRDLEDGQDVDKVRFDLAVTIAW